MFQLKKAEFKCEWPMCFRPVFSLSLCFIRKEDPCYLASKAINNSWRVQLLFIFIWKWPVPFLGPQPMPMLCQNLNKLTHTIHSWFILRNEKKEKQCNTNKSGNNKDRSWYKEARVIALVAILRIEYMKWLKLLYRRLGSWLTKIQRAIDLGESLVSYQINVSIGIL